MTEIDELRTLWADRDRQLDASLRLNRQLLRTAALDRARPPLARFAFGLGIESVFHLVAIVLLGAFIGAHLDQLEFVAPAAALDAGAIALLVATVRQLLAALRIDPAGAIVASQERLVALRIDRLRTIRWTLLTAPLAWTPLLIVGLKALFDVDAYRAFPAAWLVANLAFGALMIPFGLWLARRFADRLERSPLLQRLARDLTGANLASASDHLTNLAAFADETAAHSA